MELCMVMIDRVMLYGTRMHGGNSNNSMTLARENIATLPPGGLLLQKVEMSKWGRGATMVAS